MIWEHFGLNVGNDINGGTGLNFSQSVIQDDANYLTSLGIQYFRGNANYNNTDSKTYIRYLMKTFHDLGANVQYGLAFVLSEGAKTAIEAALVEEAIYAQSQGFERFQIGNETMINTSLSLAAAYTYLQTLPAIVSGAGYTGIITTSEAQDNFSQYTSNGIGNFDDLGLDIYGDNTFTDASIGSFISKVAAAKTTFGDNMFLSEWAVSASGTNLNIIDPISYSKWMMDRLTNIKANFTRPCYLHCWRFNGTNTLDYWAAQKDSGELRFFWFDVTGQRRGTYQ